MREVCAAKPRREWGEAIFLGAYAAHGVSAAKTFLSRVFSRANNTASYAGYWLVDSWFKKEWLFGCATFVPPAEVWQFSSSLCKQRIVLRRMKVKLLQCVVSYICYFFSCISCPLEKGFGGTLVGLKNKIWEECREFQMWKTEVLAARDGLNVWKAENIDDQGFPFLIVKLN